MKRIPKKHEHENPFFLKDKAIYNPRIFSLYFTEVLRTIYLFIISLLLNKNHNR